MKQSIQYTIFLLLVTISALGQTKIEQAKVLFDQRKYDQLKKILSPVKNKDADFNVAQYYLGRVAYEEKEYDDAIDYFEEAVESNNKVADYHFWLGNAYRNDAMNSSMISRGIQAPKMREAWEKAIALDSKNLDARVSLIQLYIIVPGFMGGSIDKAKQVVKQVIGLNPLEGHRQMGSIYMAEKNYEKAIPQYEDVIKQNPEDWTSLYQIGKASALSGQKLAVGEQCLKKYLTHTPRSNEASHAGANMRLAQIKEKGGNKVEAKKYYEIALKMDSSLKEAGEGLERVSKQ